MKPEHRNILFSLEQSSEHPLADAITAYYKEQAKNVSLSSIQSITGDGISALYNSEKYFAGTSKLLEQNNISINEPTKTWSDEKRTEAKTIVFFANSKKVLSTIAIADKIKESSKNAVAQLKNLGIDVYMLSLIHI